MADTKKRIIKKAKVVAETAPVVDSPSEASLVVEEESKTTTKAGSASTASAQPAKAGRRSTKASKEAEEKQAKEERKKSADKTDEKPKISKKPTRSKSERAGKKYREVYKKIDKEKVYLLSDALELATQTSPTKFDATVEVHINLNVDPKMADQNVRGTVALPAGTGKELKVAVVADEADSKKAASAGADYSNTEELLDKLSKEDIDFDILISTPSFMPQLGKFAKFLGPRGLMPNPKSGTVTLDVAKAVQEAKAGKIEYRVDSQGIIHISVGKVSFGADKLRQNADAALESIKSAKPASIKGTYIRSAFVTTSMGPSIKTEI